MGQEFLIRTKLSSLSLYFVYVDNEGSGATMAVWGSSELLLLADVIGVEVPCTTCSLFSHN